MEIFLNFRLDILSDAAKRNADRVYQDECGLDVTKLRLLRLISLNPGIAPSDLADQARLDRPKTSRLLTRLADRGFVERIAAESDGRQIKLKTSSEGEAIVAKAKKIAVRLESALLAPLSSDERDTLVRSLIKLTDWVEGGNLATEYRASAKSKRDVQA